MFFAILWYIASEVFASFNGKLSILVHRVKGSRDHRQPFDSYNLESLHGLVDEMYSGIPQELADIEKTYIAPCTFYKEQYSIIRTFADLLVSLKSNPKSCAKALAPAFKSTRREILAFHQNLEDRLKPYLDAVTSWIVSDDYKKEWSRLQDVYWANVASLIKIVSSMTILSAYDASVHYGNVMSVISDLHPKIMGKCEIILKKVSRAFISGLEETTDIDPLLRGLYKANILFLERLSGLRGESLTAIVDPLWIIEGFIFNFNCFRDFPQSPWWVDYSDEVEKLSAVFKASAATHPTAAVHRDLVKRHVRAMTLFRGPSKS